MPGRDGAGFAYIQATALNAAINGSISAVPGTCFVIMMALPGDSTWASPRYAQSLPYIPTRASCAGLSEKLKGTASGRGAMSIPMPAWHNEHITWQPSYIVPNHPL
jgi:hypothetical protein